MGLNGCGRCAKNPEVVLGHLETQRRESAQTNASELGEKTRQQKNTRKMQLKVTKKYSS